MRRLIVSVLLAFSWVIAATAAERLTVFAATSMTDVMAEIGKSFSDQSGIEVRFSFASTAQLARQLDGGAPVDYFITADRRWMDWALERELIEPDSVVPLASNRLVVAVRNEVENWADVDGLLTQDRFAMAEPDTVPAGRYARQALKHRGLWEKARSQAVFGDNVRTTLRRLALGEVGAAIVYGTDVLIEPRVKTLLTFPDESHEMITYWAGISRGKATGSVREFQKFLQGVSGGAIFTRAGFAPPKAVR